ncbi:hypothetical protein CP8484711_2132B, partial [Chlamydia psittaci 84-8471/1]
SKMAYLHDTFIC